MKLLRLDWDADTSLPIDLDLLKDQLRISTDEHDLLINQLHLPGAVSWAEGVMKRSILSKVHRAVFDDFPRGYDRSMRLPRGKTQSVASVAYTSNGSVTTLTGPSSGSPEGTGYREDLSSLVGGVLYPPLNEDWPDVDLDAVQPVLVTFNAGWTADRIPADILNAITMYVSDELDAIGASDITDMRFLDAKELKLSAYRIAR